MFFFSFGVDEHVYIEKFKYPKIIRRHFYMGGMIVISIDLIFSDQFNKRIKKRGLTILFN